MKKYRLLTQDGYYKEDHCKGKIYDENYQPDNCDPVHCLVRSYPNDWKEVIDIDTKIYNAIRNLELLIESRILIRDIEAYKQTISTSDSEVYIELANDQIKRLQKRLSTIEKQIAQ